MHWNETPDMPCSASVIGHKTLLTAAHCVDKIDLRRKIYVNHLDLSFQVDSIYVPLAYYPAIRNFHQAQTYQEKLYHHRNTARYDIALINLSSSLPRRYRPIKIDFRKSAEGKQVKIVGVGLTRTFFKSITVPSEVARYRMGALEL